MSGRRNTAMGREFIVKTKDMTTAGNGIREASGDLQNACSGLSSVKNSLSFQISSRTRIQKRLEDQIARLEKESRAAGNISSQLDEILMAYIGTESRLAGAAGDRSAAVPPENGYEQLREILDKIDRQSPASFTLHLVREILKKLADLARLHPNKELRHLLVMMSTGALVFADFSAHGGRDGKKGTAESGEEEPSYHTGWEFTKSMTSFLGKYLKEVKEKKGAGNILGLGGKGLGYAEDVYNFLKGDKKGLSGASDLCSLGDSSCEVWNGFYKVIENKYKDAFKKAGDIPTPYGTRMANISGSVSVIGDLFGLGGDLFDAMDSGKNPTGADKNAAFIKSTTHVVDMGTDIYDWVSKADTKGMYTPAGIYGTIASSYIESGSVAYKDIMKMKADGQWTIDDTAQTMLDSSTAGLYKMIDKLSFGLISEKTTNVSAQQISDTLKNGAVKWGTDAGMRVVNDPALKRIYDNGNEFVKGCVTVYSIAETGKDYIRQGAEKAGEAIVNTAESAWEHAKTAGEKIDSFMPWRWSW